MYRPVVTPSRLMGVSIVLMVLIILPAALATHEPGHQDTVQPVQQQAQQPSQQPAVSADYIDRTQRQDRTRTATQTRTQPQDTIAGDTRSPADRTRTDPRPLDTGTVPADDRIPTQDPVRDGSSADTPVTGDPAGTTLSGTDTATSDGSVNRPATGGDGAVRDPSRSVADEGVRTEDVLAAEEPLTRSGDRTVLDETVHSREAANINTDTRTGLIRRMTRQDLAVMEALRNYIDIAIEDLRVWADNRFARQDQVDTLEQDVNQLWRDVYGQERGGAAGTNQSTAAGRTAGTRTAPQTRDGSVRTFQQDGYTCHQYTQSRDGQTVRQLHCFQ